MDSKRIVLPGGSGFIGNFISRYFADKGFEVIVLSRTKTGVINGIRFVLWDAASIDEWTQYLEGAYAVINLTGRSINCRFTKKNKRDIIASRIDSVNVLLKACKQLIVPPRVFIQASSIGYYGNTTNLCTENAPAGNDFLAKVCTLWEDSFMKEPEPLTRKVVLRFGVVLYENGGAMERMLPWVKWYLGGQHGNGKQQISWIHLEDLARMFEFVLINPKVAGKYNATSDFPVSNAVFMSVMRKVLKKPWAPPVPAFMVRLTALLFMHADAGVLLNGVACTSKRIRNEGFVFKYPGLLQALQSILGLPESV